MCRDCVTPLSHICARSIAEHTSGSCASSSRLACSSSSSSSVFFTELHWFIMALTLPDPITPFGRLAAPVHFEIRQTKNVPAIQRQSCYYCSLDRGRKARYKVGWEVYKYVQEKVWRGYVREGSRGLFWISFKMQIRKVRGPEPACLLGVGSNPHMRVCSTWCPCSPFQCIIYLYHTTVWPLFPITHIHTSCLMTRVGQNCTY